MKQVVATALVLLLTLFLLPLLLLGEEPLAGPSQPPAATGTLPIDRTVVTPGQTADGRVQVRPGGRGGAHPAAGQVPVAGGGGGDARLL